MCESHYKRNKCTFTNYVYTIRSFECDESTFKSNKPSTRRTGCMTDVRISCGCTVHCTMYIVQLLYAKNKRTRVVCTNTYKHTPIQKHPFTHTPVTNWYETVSKAHKECARAQRLLCIAKRNAREEEWHARDERSQIIIAIAGSFNRTLYIYYVYSISLRRCIFVYTCQKCAKIMMKT